MDENRMAVVEVPFGHGTMRATIPARNLIGTYVAPGARAAEDPAGEILSALEHPIGSAPLPERLKRGMTVCVVVSDLTRPVPYRIMLPVLLRLLNRCGVSDRDITLLVATGLHRGLTPEEQAQLYGEDVVRRVRVVNHNYSDPTNLVRLGVTRHGTPIEVNRLAVETDFLLLTGYIEPHQQLGFTGGRKSIMPGIASEAAVMHNHGPKMMDDPRAVNGVLEGNPQHEDSLEFAQAVGVDFILNVVLNEEEKLVKAVAGDLVEAWLAGVELSRSFREVVLPEPCDVAVTASGAPLDQVLYQGPKIASAVFRAEDPIVRDGGTVIVPMEATEGVGHHREFYELMCSGQGNPDAVIERCYTSPVKDQWGSQIWARMLQRLRMTIVTQNMTPAGIEAMGVTHQPTLQQALDEALACYGPDCKVAVFPRATTVLPRLAKQPGRTNEQEDR
ncbi:MAG: nickel-dependent lactate racemase [Bacillota bacterium]|nr:nickel-dependent lactate racemase [Bacillota bacterium]